MLATRTGHFPIGFRRGWSDWQKDLNQVVAFARENGVGVVDVGADVAAVRAITAAGLRVGSADATDWGKLMSEDKSVRAEAVAKNIAFATEAVAAGAKNFFICMLPADPKRSRAENFASLLDSLQSLVPAYEKLGARLAIEGYPGNGAIITTPEGYRALFKEFPSKAVAINFDPSHLIRMSIDPVRFLGEFADRVVHVHGKDTEILTDAVYDYGSELPAMFAKGHGFGAYAWRYTLPGHGMARWSKMLAQLKDAGYHGAVCIELEDENFNGTAEGEKAGILAGAQYLAST